MISCFYQFTTLNLCFQKASPVGFAFVEKKIVTASIWLCNIVKTDEENLSCLEMKVPIDVRRIVNQLIVLLSKHVTAHYTAKTIVSRTKKNKITHKKIKGTKNSIGRWTERERKKKKLLIKKM